MEVVKIFVFLVGTENMSLFFRRVRFFFDDEVLDANLCELCFRYCRSADHNDVRRISDLNALSEKREAISAVEH